jgi:hypothetical protein
MRNGPESGCVSYGFHARTIVGIFPCASVERYYSQKKLMACGCEPSSVAELIAELKSAGLVEIAWLAGAGGGGFLYVWTTPDTLLPDVRSFLGRNPVRNALRP